MFLTNFCKQFADSWPCTLLVFLKTYLFFWLFHKKTFPNWSKTRLNRQTLNSDLRWQVGSWHDCNSVWVLTVGGCELKQLPSLLTWTSASVHVRGQSYDSGSERTNSDSGLLKKASSDGKVLVSRTSCTVHVVQFEPPVWSNISG